MEFAVSDYGQEAARIRSLDGNGARPMPLVSGKCSQQARAALKPFTPRTLFPHARSPGDQIQAFGAMAGLNLYFACKEKAHAPAQNLNTAEGSFRHGILHRQEPDAANAAYWFRQLGKHAIFPALRDAALHLGFACGAAWDPMEFIAFREVALTLPGFQSIKSGSAEGAWPCRCSYMNGSCCSIFASRRK